MESIPPLPSLVLSEWNQFCEEIGETARANQLRIDVFFQFQAEFQKKGFDVLPLKGMDLLLRAYPSPGLRPMADCDLLIRKEDIPAVMRLFEERGFTRRPDEGLTYISRDKSLNFDILWDIWYLQDMAKIWERSIPYLYEGHPLRMLHPEDALLYLVTYVTAHRGVLSPLLAADLRFFLEAEGDRLDWRRCAKQAAALKIKIPFYRGLLYAAKNGCDQIPREALALFSPATPRELRLLRLYEKIVTEESHPPVSYFFTWLSYPGLSCKLKFLREKLLPAKWEADIHWGRGSYPAYLMKIFFRPFYLVFRSILILTRDLFFFLPRHKK